MKRHGDNWKVSYILIRCRRSISKLNHEVDGDMYNWNITYPQPPMITDVFSSPYPHYSIHNSVDNVYKSVNNNENKLSCGA